MFRMPRLTLFLAAALVAAPGAAPAQPADRAAVQPSRPVDECGKPATPGRPRRGTAPRTSGTASDTAEGPRVLGTPAGAAGSGSAAPTPAAGPTVDGSHPPVTASSSTSAELEPATAASSMSVGSRFANAGGSAVCVGTTGSLTGTGGGLPPAERPIDPHAARRNRGALQLGLGRLGDQLRLGPAASVSVPTAFGVDAGEMFFGIAYQERTRYTESSDAAAVVGIGVGTRRVLALEAALTTYSTIRGEPLETGGISVKLHRALPRQTSVAVGWENAVLWGGSDDDGSLYGVVTKLVNLREDAAAPFSTAVFTVGVGNGRFRFEDDDAAGNETVNLFAAAGARVTPRVSLVADWTGQDLNAAASLTPIPRVPAVITIGLADLTGTAGDGARLILSLGYGLAFRQPF